MRPRISDPATYRSGTPRIQPPAVARWHTLIHGLATAIHETFELARKFHYPCLQFSSPLPAGKAGFLKRGEDFFDLTQKTSASRNNSDMHFILSVLYPSILCRSPRSQKCKLRDVIHSSAVIEVSLMVIAYICPPIFSEYIWHIYCKFVALLDTVLRFGIRFCQSGRSHFNQSQITFLKQSIPVDFLLRRE